jgi:hypothetical protein
VSLARLGRPAAAVAAPPLAPTAVARGAPAPRAARRPVPAAAREKPAPTRHGRIGLALFVLAAGALGAFAAAHWMAREVPSPEVATASASISPPRTTIPVAPPVRSAPLDAPETAPAVQPSTTPPVTPKPQKSKAPRLTASAKADCDCAPGSPKGQPEKVPDDPFASRL